MENLLTVKIRIISCRVKSIQTHFNYPPFIMKTDKSSTHTFFPTLSNQWLIVLITAALKATFLLDNEMYDW